MLQVITGNGCRVKVDPVTYHLSYTTDEYAITQGDVFGNFCPSTPTPSTSSPTHHYQSYLTVSFIKLSHLIYARDRYFFRARLVSVFFEDEKINLCPRYTRKSFFLTFPTSKIIKKNLPNCR